MRLLTNRTWFATGSVLHRSIAILGRDSPQAGIFLLLYCATL